jgi:glycosyltransferase involved in cell wall biosynthesis
MESLALIIPVYNEDQVIEGTVFRLQGILRAASIFAGEIICVNDGSTDKTAQILDRLPGITVLSHDVNRGYGAALRTALDYCSEEWIFIVDADGTYPLEDLPRLLEETKNAYDMVIGARQGPGISSNPAKRLARWILRKLVHGVTGVMVPDLNSGMRVFRRALYREFRHLLPMGFSFTSTITVASLYTGYRLKYIPIVYSKRVGDSNIRPIRDFFGFTILILRLASYFEPLKFFLPLSTFVAIAAILRGVRDVLVVNYIGGVAIILMFFSFQILAIGILADVVVRRSLSSSTPAGAAEKRFVVKKNPPKAGV